MTPTRSPPAPVDGAVTPRTHRHREQDTADTGQAAQTAPQTRSWLRYRYRARAARGPLPEGRRGAPSSPPPSDDRDALEPELVGGRERLLDERLDDRALVAGGEVGSTSLELPRRGGRAPRRGGAVLRPEKQKSRPGTRATGKSYAAGSPPAPGDRAPRRPDSRARGGARPCRTPLPRRRRASSRRRGSRGGPGRRAGACARRSRAGRGRAGRPGSARDRARRRGRAGGRRGREEAARPGERLRGREADEQSADQPGPRVTATDSTSSSSPRARSSASVTTGATSSRWRRDATSGTTPP